MHWPNLARSLHQPIKLIALHTNATFPLSDWFIREVRSRRYIVIENPATGYVLRLGSREIRGFEYRHGVPCLDLKIALVFNCPNVQFVYPDESSKREQLSKAFRHAQAASRTFLDRLAERSGDLVAALASAAK
jgi:hypothetical protein